MGGTVFPPFSLARGQTLVGVMVMSFKRTMEPAGLLRTVVVSAPDPTAGQRQLTPPLETQGLTGKSSSVSCGATALFPWVLVGTRFCLCPPSFFPQSCGSSVIKYHWLSKSNSQGVLSPFAGSPG